MGLKAATKLAGIRHMHWQPGLLYQLNSVATHPLLREAGHRLVVVSAILKRTGDQRSGLQEANLPHQDDGKCAGSERTEDT